MQLGDEQIKNETTAWNMKWKGWDYFEFIDVKVQWNNNWNKAECAGIVISNEWGGGTGSSSDITQF